MSRSKPPPKKTSKSVDDPLSAQDAKDIKEIQHDIKEIKMMAQNLIIRLNTPRPERSNTFSASDIQDLLNRSISSARSYDSLTTEELEILEALGGKLTTHEVSTDVGEESEYHTRDTTDADPYYENMEPHVESSHSEDPRGTEELESNDVAALVPNRQISKVGRSSSVSSTSVSVEHAITEALKSKSSSTPSLKTNTHVVSKPKAGPKKSTTSTSTSTSKPKTVDSSCQPPSSGIDTKRLFEILTRIKSQRTQGKDESDNSDSDEEGKSRKSRENAKEISQRSPSQKRMYKLLKGVGLSHRDIILIIDHMKASSNTTRRANKDSSDED